MLSWQSHSVALTTCELGNGALFAPFPDRARFPPREKHWRKRKQLEQAQAVSKCALRRRGGTESRKNAHSIISDKQDGILLPSRFAAIRLSAIRQTISRKPGLMPCRWLAPCKRLSLRLYRSALTAVLLVPYLAANRHICFCFRR